MKRAVSVSLGSSERDKQVVVAFDGQPVSIERIGTDGDVERAKHLFSELDGEVDAFGVGGVDLYLRLGEREYPLHAALKLVAGVRQTPIVDGRGLKHTLERRVFELADLPGLPAFKQAFVPVAIDRIGLAEAVAEVADNVVYGDLMVALEVPVLPAEGISVCLRTFEWPLETTFSRRMEVSQAVRAGITSSGRSPAVAASRSYRASRGRNGSW